ETRDLPAEKLLQAVWQHQRLRRDSLHTFDGRPVRILHPGFKNVEAGPDFRGAVIQFGDEPPGSGDVEIDVSANGWRAHGHARNRNSQNVILHVVWEDSAVANQRDILPVLALQKVLDAPLAELDQWIVSDAVETWPDGLRGRCCQPLRDLPP